ncbi:MBL fold metallo-hydrolase [Mucilaginibacter sp.]|uniref:ComEC/Rec2 family competence protein n=1 Tax=Mucilaginibacter sp. TaxID=1882438 RepID=UPI0026274932|nr:MBL fold metallo-hydrolase [Mucilaginibacter sp.]
MDIKITMLNVGDGDAIIVQLTKNKQQLIILIDAGHPGDAQLCIDALNPVLKSSGKNAPDLVMVSHYDADHIGGMKAVVEHYGAAIGQVWLHKPGILIKAAEQAAGLLLEHLADPPKENIQDFLGFHGDLNPNEARQFVLESYNQMKDLVGTLDKYQIKTVEPFAGQSLANWPEVSVLGPTPAFYQACLKKMKDVPNLIAQETLLVLNESKQEPFIGKLSKMLEKDTDPCGYLKSQKKDHVTEVNQISIILQIIADGKKYLFTGDASLESFQAVSQYPDSLRNIYWLKVPHHGSHNNSSPEIFDIMKPVYADISGGDRYLDEEVPGCLTAKGTKVRTTLDTKTNLIFPY